MYSQEPPSESAELLRDVAASVGLDFHYTNGASGELYFAEIMGSGGALFDLEGDGDLDIYLVQGGRLGPNSSQNEATDAAGSLNNLKVLSDRLYRNDSVPDPQGSHLETLRFTDITASAGLPSSRYGMGVASGDFDNDGLTDLYITNLGANQLLRNRGDGTFEDVAESAAVADSAWSLAASFFDFDRDGWLDLYVVNYVDFSLANHKFCPDPTGAKDYCGPMAYKPVADRLYRNLGDGRFEDVSSQAGITKTPGTGLGVVAGDYNADGWLDLYVANDQMTNHLFLNQGDGSFRDEALVAGCGVNEEGVRQSSMGVDSGDLDGDGDLDLFMTHLKGETNTLYRNEAGSFFEDSTRTAGLGTPSWSMTGFGAGFFDLENDGDLDIFVANGAVTLFSNQPHKGLAQSDQLFVNQGGGSFVEADLSRDSSKRPTTVGRGVAFGDIDNDGDTDLLAIDNAGPVRLLINQAGAGNSWLGLELLEATPGNLQNGKATLRLALGAEARLLSATGKSGALRSVKADGSYASANDARILFGLGTSSNPRSIRVRWVDGSLETWEGLAPETYHQLVKGQGKAEKPEGSSGARKP